MGKCPSEKSNPRPHPGDSESLPLDHLYVTFYEVSHKRTCYGRASFWPYLLSRKKGDLGGNRAKNGNYIFERGVAPLLSTGFTTTASRQLHDDGFATASRRRLHDGFATASPSSKSGPLLTDFRACVVSFRVGVPPPLQSFLSLEFRFAPLLP